ncbi:hypothetical protein AHAS_Ahas09G0066900 [Arachis hypogaea]
MLTHKCERGWGRGRIGNAMPEAIGNNPPNPVDFMVALGNMVVAMQAIAEALGNQINNGNNVNNGDEEFYKKYFSSSVKNAKELELLQLKQGQMTVTEYTSKFEELCHFSRICQGALEDFAEWKCIKYEGGLRSDIMSFVAPMEIRVFFELVNKSRIAKECVRNVAVAKNDNRESRQRDYRQDLVPKSQEFKRTKNYRPNRQHKNKQGLCYWCRSLGHLVKDCPSPRGGNS